MSSSKECLHDMYNVVNLDEAVFELCAESSSSPTRFMRRTREIWDETSNMHFAKLQPPHQMATINVNVPTALASKIHKLVAVTTFYCNPNFV